MPQIKFSGLVTAMKGKAGGSIFSQNKQGAYFRNNRWGGGRKSARWDAAKQKLTQLSNSWRALSSEQRQAWQDAAANFPFTNKFGDEYIGSGYQVYMSLNGNLYAQQLPLLTSPGEARPFPEDITFNVSNPDIPWVTGGTGATFPYISSSQSNPCGLHNPCPEGYECMNGNCITNFVVGSPEYNVIRKKVRDQFYMFVDPECKSDTDCVDAGLTGASADVACQNGRCVYVGDGLQEWESLAYVLNISNALFNGGVWTQGTESKDAFVAGSFRFSLGEQTLRKLLTSYDEIVLVSNYYNDGRGTTIRIRPQDQTTTRIYVTYGLNTPDIPQGCATYAWYIDVSTSEFKDNCVLQFQFNLADTTQSFIALNNMSFAYGQFAYWEGAKEGPIAAWGDPYDTVHNPYANWSTVDYWYGFVYGAGIQSSTTSVIYSDVRFYSEQYTDIKYALSGMLQGSETVLILMSGNPKPGCSFGLCETNSEKLTCTVNKCICDGQFCGPWVDILRYSSNLAPGGDTTIVLHPSVPIFNFTKGIDDVSSLQFAEYWTIKKGGHYANNGATFVPLTTASIGGTNESGFSISVSVTRAKSYSSTFRGSELINMTLIPADQSANYELWEFIKAAITSAPPGTSFWIGFNIIDTNSGATQYDKPKKRIRFKAGAELSSSVN